MLALPPAPPAVAAATSSPIPQGLRSRLDALERARDWGGIADLMEGLPPGARGTLLETWLRALAKAGRHPRLLEVCEAAVSQLDGPKGPRLSTARIYRAQALSALERRAEAREAHLENALLGYLPGFPNACAEARRAEDWKALAACAEAWRTASPEAAEALAWKGEALAKQGLWAEAEPLLLQATERLPARAMAWADLSACRFERGDIPEAWAAADRAVALEPKLLEALYNRGRAAFALKRYVEGRADFAAVLALTPSNPELVRQLQTSVASVDRYLAQQAKKGPARRR